jgi:hypothetical protein
VTAENVLVDSGSPTEPFVEEASERVGSQVVQLVVVSVQSQRFHTRFDEVIYNVNREPPSLISNSFLVNSGRGSRPVRVDG